jgi:thioester reductase-like protein
MRSDLGQIFADAVLSGELHPETTGPVAPSNVALITGSTGFLGRYVVARLLDNTDLRLVLLARARDGQSAEHRMKAILLSIGVDEADLLGRVRVVEGDVTQGSFGLEPETYEDLAGQVDTIFHCSAAVDWVRDYDRLRQVNVEGVREVIGFACRRRRKRIVFSSSIAVCMFNEDAGQMAEYTPVLEHISKMPLGYARSKAVAENLLYQCAERGVPVTIIRAPLISGHSLTGRSNPSDIFAALLQACIVTGRGPDTDWTFDIAPVDYVSRIFTDVPQGADTWQVLNLKQQNSRTWGNLLTWINLHGYSVERVATDDWIRHLFADGAARGLMLYTQRQYFAGRPPRAGEADWVRPYEAYLSESYARVDGRRTSAMLAELGIEAPDIDIDLLHGYFSDLREAKILPERAQDTAAGASEAKAALAAILAQHKARRIGKESGLMNQLAASQMKDLAGVWVLDGLLADASGAADARVIKLKPNGSILRDQSIVLASVASPRLGELFRRYDDPFELRQSDARERAIYRNPPSGLAQFMPKIWDTDHELAPGQYCLVLEYLESAERDTGAGWIRSTDSDFKHVLEGMAAIHAGGLGRAIEMDSRIKPVRTPSASRMAELMPLWDELAKVSRAKFREFGGEGAVKRHASIVHSLSTWWPQYEALPQTLIHNDFNPRNFILRPERDPPQLCAYDWEIAAIGPPQRDLAELLCFTWSAGAARSHLEGILDQTRCLLEASTQSRLPSDHWRRGFRLALKYFLISRLPLYVLADGLSALPFLPRLIANSMELFAVTEEFADA